ncbi:MAG: glycoside hydrolase family 88 protein [Clostridia bacterium]|nr:glycoside hydrolase family 88 protein [Clostridia bacterium]
MKMKKALSLLLALTMLIGAMPTVLADDREVVSYEISDAVTTVGSLPVLPESVALTLSDGTVSVEFVTWQMFDERLLSSVGTFEATGVSESGYEVKTTVIVMEAYSDIEVTEGLIAYYDFNNIGSTPSVIPDVSGNGNDARVLNTVVQGDGGWNPGANNVLTITEDGTASFPGNTSSWWTNYLGAALKLPNNINSDVESFSFSAWIKADGEYSSANKMTRFFDFGNLGSGTNNPYNSIFARYTSSSGLLRIQDRSVNVYQEHTISARPFTDVWGLFTFVYEKNEETGYFETKVYVNGEEVPELTTTDVYTRALSDLGELTDVNNGFFIGRTVWGATNQEVADNPDFKGQMDEIRIYNRGLTEGQVKYLYETTCPEGNIEVTGYYAEDVVTLAGDYPLLPENVTVYYNTGAEKKIGVTWDVISSDKYAQEGSFMAGGYTEDGSYVEVKVVVIKKDTSTLNQGLLAYYTFNDDAENPDTIIDASGNNNNASVHNLYQEVSSGGNWGGGGTTTVVERKMTVTDGVLNFPGAIIGEDVGLGGRNQRNRFFSGPAIRMPDGINEGAEEFTYAAWIYADTDYRYASGLQRFFDFGNDLRDSFFFRYVPSTGETTFQDRGIASGSSDENSLISATLEDNPFADKWAHLVVTYEKSTEGEYYTPHIYIDGVERYEFDNSLTTLTRPFGAAVSSSSSNYGFWIGKTQWAFDSSNASTNPEFKGKMDEIRLYDRALSSSEVAELYNAKKPSDAPVDYESMPKTVIAITEDVELSGKYPDTNINGEVQLLVSSNNGAAYTRYGLMRTGEMSVGEIASAANCEKAILSVYVTLVDNAGDDEYYCYGLTGDSDNWDVDAVTMNNYSEVLGGTITDLGVSTAGELLDTQIATGQMKDFYMQWDVTEFVKEHAAEGFSFLLTCGSDVAYILTSEAGEEGKTPELIIYQQGTPIIVKRVDTEGNEISSSVVYGVMGEGYTYNVADALVSYNNTIYAVNEELSSLTIDAVTGEDVIEVVYEKAEDVRCDNVSVRTYVGKAPTLPRVLNVYSGNHSAIFAVQWETIDSSAYAEKGVFEVEGTILGTDVTATANVTVFPEYNGQVGGDLVLYIYKDGELDEEKRINKAFGSSFTLDESYGEYLGNLYELDKIEGDVTEIGQSIAMNSLNQEIHLYFVMKEAIEGDLAVKIKADNFEQTSYTLTATAKVLNTKKTDETVRIIIADYNGDGELTNAVTEGETIYSRTGEEVTFSKSIAYNAEVHKNSVIYLWTGNIEPVADVIYVKDVPVSGYMSEEVYNMLPTYDSAVETIRKANDYWQSNYSPSTWTNGIHPAFWARAAYHTGNMEVYRLIEDETYLQHSIDWANYNKWMGNDYTGDPSRWTWGYNQTQGSDAVLFGDWQICFQSYLDMYEFGVADANVDRVFEVMDYQVSKEEDGFWWWADALYMVMPVMSKLYKHTEDEKYLDALYKWFKFAKEYMYDGPGGIPTSADGYTTSASLKNGAQYSDPDNYAYLFYRDSGYVYPLNPNPGHENEKNFWARGDGWVFAGLAKVLSDMPATYEHYDEFYNTYMEMAAAIIACQKTDSDGYGFWTQSMLQNYPVGNNGNNEGYETSGTAFFTYGLFWGINNGFLDEETYLEPAVRAWGYLKDVALHSSGKVGYVQPIGSNATQATPYDTTQDFGVGAYLLACCEAARYAENNE